MASIMKLIPKLNKALKGFIYNALIKFYRQIFNEDYIISLFKPKKNQCELCTFHKNDVGHNAELQAKYEQHQIEK